MRQTLFTIPDELFGIPVFGVGLLLIVWTFFSVAFVAWLVRRHGFNRETQGYLPVLILVAVAIAFLLPSLIEGGGVPIRGYGVMFLLGVVAGVALAAYRAPYYGLDREAIIALAFWMIVAGLVGARLFHVIEYWDISYKKYNQVGGQPVFDLTATLKAVINVPKGGLVVYGAFIGGVAAMWWFLSKHKLPVLAVADLIAPSLVVGLALGRVGCLLNGCCYGGVCNLPWSISFPQSSSAVGFTPPYSRQLEHGWMFGIYVQAASADRLVIRHVRPGSSADRAELKTGDVIESIDGYRLKPKTIQGREVSATAQMAELFELKNSLSVRTEQTRAYLIWTPQLVSPETAALSPSERLLQGLGVRFGAEQGKVLIQYVHPESMAALRGLAVGDRVTEVEGQAVKTLDQIQRILVRKTRIHLRLAADSQPALLPWDPPPRTSRLQPTQIYSAINATLLALFLFSYHPFRRRDGEVFAILVTIYPVTRFLLEIIRTDESAMFGTGLSISQLVSILLLIAVVLLWVTVLRQPKGRLWAQRGKNPAVAAE